MNKWSQLANARLIDWILESLRINYSLWYDAHAHDEVYDDDDYEAWNAAYESAWNAALDTGLETVWGAVENATRDAAWGTGLTMAQGAILALMVYDDCDQYLSMTYDQLLTWALLSERPQVVLLLPLKWVQEHEPLVTLT